MEQISNTMDILSANSVKVNVEEQTSIIKLILEPGDEMGKILSFCTTPTLLNVIANDGKIGYVVRLDATVVYVTEDGRVKSQTTFIENSFEFDDNRISGNDIILPSVKLINIGSYDVSPKEVKVSVTVKPCFIITKNETVPLLTTDDDYYFKTENIKLYQSGEIIQDNFLEENEAKIVGQLEEILCKKITFVPFDFVAGNGYIEFTGDIRVELCYSLNDSSEIASFSTSFPVKNRVLAPQINELSPFYAKANINESDVTITSTQSDNYNQLKISANISFMGQIFNENDYNNIIDAYSTTNEILLSFETVQNIDKVVRIIDNQNFSGNVTIEDDRTSVVFACGTKVVIANNLLEDQNIIIDGIVTTNLILQNIEDKKYSSLLVDMPFEINLKATEQNLVLDCVDVVVKNLNFSQNKQNVSLEGSILIMANAHIEKSELITTNSSLGEEIIADDYNLKIIIANENETLWDIAKRLRVDSETLISQNPGLLNGINKGDKIVLYKQLFSIN